jgi:hypothetical protein
MTRLRRTAGLVLNVERYGGNLTQRDDSTILLKNYRCLNARLLALMESGPLTAEPVEALLDRFDAWSSARGAAKEEL